MKGGDKSDTRRKWQRVLYNSYRLQNTGIYRIYNPKALGCGARAKGLRVINSVDPCVLKSNFLDYRLVIVATFAAACNK